MRIAAIALLVFSVFSAPAAGTIVTYDFTALGVSETTYPQSRVFTNGPLTLTVTALGVDEGNPFTSTENEGVSFTDGKGLGVKDVTDLLSSDISAVDGNLGNEELIFTFNRDVLFQSITFVDHSNQAFANEVFFLLNDSSFGDFNGTGVRIAFFNADANAGTGNPQWQGLPDYPFPADKQGPKTVIKVFVQDGDSGVYVSSLTVDDMVPEPQTYLMMGTGLAFLGAMALIRRRRAR